MRAEAEGSAVADRLRQPTRGSVLEMVGRIAAMLVVTIILAAASAAVVGGAADRSSPAEADP